MADTTTNTETSSSKTNGKAKMAEPSLDDLKSEIEMLKADIRRLTSVAGDVAQAEARRAADVVRSTGETYRATGEAKIDELRRTAEGYGEDAATYVKEQPMNALGIAAGVGFILGFMMTRR